MLAAILREGAERAGQVASEGLKPEDFHSPGNRIIAEVVWEAMQDGDPIDPVSVGGRAATSLAKVWGKTEAESQKLVTALAKIQVPGDLAAHTGEVSYQARRRDLADLLDHAKGEVENNAKTPEEVAGGVSEGVLAILTDRVTKSEVISHAEAGRRFLKEMKRRQQIVHQGGELGAKFGLPFIDDFTGGIQPGELWMLGGGPGVGKTAISMLCAQRFARAQSRKPPEEQVGTLVLSLEMDEWQYSSRLAQEMAKISGRALRSGNTTDDDYRRLAEAWGAEKNYPIYFTYPSGLTASQIKSTLVEWIRRKNIGFVVLDHFTYFHMDKWYDDQRREQGDKMRFLKQSLAKDLGLAVCCLSHTNKNVGRDNDPRPRMEDMKGVREVSMLADMISFLWSPYDEATEQVRQYDELDPGELEIVWAKNRMDRKGERRFKMDFDTMTAT